MTKTVYIGMDVHSTNYTLSSYIFGENQCFATCTLAPKMESILTYVARIKAGHGADTEILCGYEAGCLGYTLYKDLKDNNINCVIVAPTTLPKRKSGEIKTDKRDAQKIAHALATGTYKSVYIPDDEDDEVKQYIRMRDDHKLQIKKVKQQILALCMRNGLVFTAGKSKWTQKHMKWLRSVEMSEMMREILDEYLITYDYLSLRLKNMDEKIEAIAANERYKENVSKLVCFSGISTHKALCHIVEQVISIVLKMRNPILHILDSFLANTAAVPMWTDFLSQKQEIDI